MPRHLAAPDGSALPWFYKVLWRGLAERGARMRVVHRDQDALQAQPCGADFDFVHQGIAPRTRLLNTAIAYFGDYYYADPNGIYFQSSITTALFDPCAQNPDHAAAFFIELRNRYVVARKSRAQQREDVEKFSPGAIAVFLQDWSLPVERARYMDANAMLEAVLAGANGRQIILKPHPRNLGEETLLLCHRLRKIRQVTITDANLHDILAASVVCVSISSSVAVEAMLHRVPPIFFGRSDLHHCGETVTQAADFPAAIDRALSRTYPYEAFIYWFLRKMVLRTGPRMIPKLLERMQSVGADLAALGITGTNAGGEEYHSI